MPRTLKLFSYSSTPLLSSPCKCALSTVHCTGEPFYSPRRLEQHSASMGDTRLGRRRVNTALSSHHSHHCALPLPYTRILLEDSASDHGAQKLTLTAVGPDLSGYGAVHTTVYCTGCTIYRECSRLAWGAGWNQIYFSDDEQNGGAFTLSFTESTDTRRD